MATKEVASGRPVAPPAPQEGELAPGPVRTRRLERVLGHPLAFLATAGILLALFGGPFVFHPGRPAPANDPAAYAWRAEAIMFETPATFLAVDGPQNMLTAGYRVTTPVIAALLRRIGGVSPLTPTLLLMIGIRVVTPLLLAGLIYREVKDPLAFHVAAFGTASVLSTVLRGYLDNTLALAFLTASLHLIGPSRRSWPARAGMGLLLTLCGLTHPTTLAVFCGALVVAAATRLVWAGAGSAGPQSGRAPRGANGERSPLLSFAVVALLITAVVWSAGIWGPGVSLLESGTSPPGSRGFFRMRLVDWLLVLQPWFNLPLLGLGLVAFVRGRRAIDDDSYRVALVWFLPIIGVAGVLLDVAYPFHRFLNVAISWVAFMGLGTYVATRVLLRASTEGSSRRAVRLLAAVGLVALALGITGNFVRGFEKVGFNTIKRAWITPQERADLDLVRANLADVSDRPVVFVADTSRFYPVRIFAFIKRVAHVSRYGIADEQQDRAFVYLGTLENYLAGKPTRDDRATYTGLSRATLDDLEGVPKSEPPVVILTRSFNRTGANTELTYRDADLTGMALGEAEVWVAAERELTEWSGGHAPLKVSPGQAEGAAPGAGLAHVLRVVAGLMLLLVPGWLLARVVLPGASAGELVGMVPVLAVAAVALAGVAVIAVTRAPFSPAAAWASLGIACASCAALNLSFRVPLVRQPIVTSAMRWLHLD